jgi:hypothetical protein
MDPAIFIEAEEARLSQCVADARESIREAERKLTRQRQIVEALERAGQHTMAARRELAALTAAHRLNEKRYASSLQRLDQTLADC